MRDQGVGRAELARRLRWHLPQVVRVLDLRHASKMEQVETALAALGLRLIVDVARRHTVRAEGGGSLHNEFGALSVDMSLIELIRNDDAERNIFLIPVVNFSTLNGWLICIVAVVRALINTPGEEAKTGSPGNIEQE